MSPGCWRGIRFRTRHRVIFGRFFTTITLPPSPNTEGRGHGGSETSVASIFHAFRLTAIESTRRSLFIENLRRFSRELTSPIEKKRTTGILRDAERGADRDRRNGNSGVTGHDVSSGTAGATQCAGSH